ncbi:MAG: hypothetical protein U0167_15425 [bacterium]
MTTDQADPRSLARRAKACGVRVGRDGDGWRLVRDGRRSRPMSEAEVEGVLAVLEEEAASGRRICEQVDRRRRP